jgi:hypothetical protein
MLYTAENKICKWIYKNINFVKLNQYTTPRKQLALPSLTGGGRSVGIVRSRTEAMELFIYYTTPRCFDADRAHKHIRTHIVDRLAV